MCVCVYAYLCACAWYLDACEAAQEKGTVREKSPVFCHESWAYGFPRDSPDPWPEINGIEPLSKWLMVKVF